MARRALSGGLAAFIALGTLVITSTRLEAASIPPPPPRTGVAVLFVEDRASFDELMAVPEFQALARAGGAGLMATNQSYRDDPHEVYLALGAGAAPESADMQLLGRTLQTNLVYVCVSETSTQSPPTATSDELLLGVPRLKLCGGTPVRPAAFIVVIDDGLASLDTPSTANGLTGPNSAERERTAVLAAAGRRLAQSLPPSRALVMVMTPSPSRPMNAAGDEVTPIVMAEGFGSDLLSASHSMHALTSDTTRQVGLVANVDVAPTILDFFGIPVPSTMDGSVIRATDDPAPFALYRLEREQRRVRLPIQLAVVLFLAAAAIVATVALIVLARQGSLPEPFLGGLRFLVLCCAALPISLMAGGLLPRRTYLAVVPFVVGLTVLLSLAARGAARGDPLRALSLLGMVGLAFIVVDAAFGAHAFRAPLFGGIMFDGVRYYGLGNAFIPTLVASSVFVAWPLERTTAVAVLFGAGLVAGFPHLLADVGASITMFAAAGLWWTLARRPRPNAREWRTWVRAAVAVGVAVVVGLGIVLLVNRYGPGSPTHATRFVERTHGRLGAAIRDVWHRLGIGVGQIRRYPVGLLPLIGLPVALWLAVRGPGPIGVGLRTVDDRWGDLIVVLVLAAVIGYVANDTGVAASAPAFLYVFAALALPAFTAASRTVRTPV